MFYGPGQALRAHFKTPERTPTGGYPHEVFVARIDSGTKDPEGVIINPLVAQIYAAREGREVGQHSLSFDELIRYVVGRVAYIANEGPHFRLNGVLGYCLPEVDSGAVRVTEGAVRDAGTAHRRHPGAMFAEPMNVPLDVKGYTWIVGSMFAPILEDLAPEPGTTTSLVDVDFHVDSAHPSHYAKIAMSRLGMQRVESGFAGNAAVAYAAIGTLGLQQMFPDPPGATGPNPANPGAPQ